MVDIVEKHHSQYDSFFTPEECQHIISVFEEYKDEVPHGTYEETGYTGLTSTYQSYNWLYHPELEHLKIEQRLFNLPEFNKWQFMTLQCWGNALHIGENLGQHYHGHEMQNESMRRYRFYNANIFLGGEYNQTWYEDIDYVNNDVGDIHVFSCDLEHRVDENTGQDTRYSMAIDIYPEYNQLLHGSWQSADAHMGRYKISKNEYDRYRDTIAMRFYIARALFAIDFHNTKILEESQAGNKKGVQFHENMRDRLIAWNNDYKDHVHELEEQNRQYGFEPDVPPLHFDVDRSSSRHTIFKKVIDPFTSKGLEDEKPKMIDYRAMSPDDIDQVMEDQKLQQTDWDAEGILDKINSEDHECIIQEYNGQYSGYSFVHYEKRNGRAHVSSICTIPEYRGDGLALDNLQRIDTTIRNAGYKKLYLVTRDDNESAHRLYEKHGFKEVGTIKEYYEDAADAVEYLKKV